MRVRTPNTYAPHWVAIGTWCVLGIPMVAHAAAPSASGGGASETIISVSLAGLMSLGSGVLTHFVTRREWSAKVADLERRIGVVEGGPSRNEHNIVREHQTTMAAEFRNDVGQLHEKINRVDRAVAAVETETRVQSRSLDSIMRHFGIRDPFSDNRTP